MRICIFQHGPISLPVVGYGGIERITQGLFLTLADLRYEVTLVTVSTSTISHPNAKVIKLSMEDLEAVRWGKIKVMELLGGEQVDIFQTHTSGIYQKFDFTGFAGEWFSTCHGDEEHAACPNQMFVSDNQYQINNKRYDIDRNCRNVFVCNGGIDDSSVRYVKDGPHNRIVWLGGIRPVKGAHILPLISKAVGERILVAGSVSSNDREYFEKHIKVEFGKTIDFHGPINTEEEKTAFFSQAKVYLHTPLFNDPFPLTVLEAQACGVPVIALNNGSMMESNFDAKLVCPDIETIIDRFKEKAYAAVNPMHLMRWTMQNFSFLAMTNKYLSAWKAVLRTR